MYHFKVTWKKRSLWEADTFVWSENMGKIWTKQIIAFSICEKKGENKKNMKNMLERYFLSKWVKESSAELCVTKTYAFPIKVLFFISAIAYILYIKTRKWDSSNALRRIKRSKSRKLKFKRNLLYYSDLSTWKNVIN